jgi:hypothetical protein
MVNKVSCRFPEKHSARVCPIPHPEIRPKFSLNKSEPVFTIGSCFAREIEDQLTDFDVPTRGFSAPHEEWPHRPNGLLNEYNPGTIARRIKMALAGTQDATDTIVRIGSKHVDLLLPGGSAVDYSRALSRRAEIFEIYSQLRQAECVIITLGLVEAWVDSETNTYLNRMPPLDVLKRSNGRYVFRSLDVGESLQLMDGALRLLDELGRKVILTVSPVPLQTTFSGMDALIANCYSKAVLRACAHALSSKYPCVDYFPSYEMVTLCGPDAFASDNVHVSSDVVAKVTRYMTEAYIEPASETAIRPA